MTEVVHLISIYKNFKMLTNTKPIQFTNGVAKVEFKTREQADEFIKNIEDNPSLGAYCRVVEQKKAEAVADKAKTEAAQASASGIQVGAQTSDIDKNIIARQAQNELNLQNFYKKD